MSLNSSGTLNSLQSRESAFYFLKRLGTAGVMTILHIFRRSLSAVEGGGVLGSAVVGEFNIS